MSLHDSYARVTPFEIAFRDDESADLLVSRVEEEAKALGVDPQVPGVFSTLRSVADASRDLLAPDAPSEAVNELGALLFHAVHFARCGKPLYLLRTAAARYLVGGPPDGAPRPPSAAGYLQLPQHLFWMGAAGDAAPESIDGVFWFASDSGGLHLLPITGLLPDHMAFRALPLAEAPLGEADHWLGADMRERGEDFGSSLPGHELDGLYALETAGEVLKLVARFFAYLDRVPHAAAPGGAFDPGSTAAAEAEAAAGPSTSPRPSRLPFTAVALVP